MIGVERRGRLGNQLFQFAFALSAAKALGTSFVMNDSELLPLFDLGRQRRLAGRAVRSAHFRVGNRLRPYPVVTVTNESSAPPEEMRESLRDRTVYAGYFQSERFFADAADDVRRAFRPLPVHAELFRKRYGDLLEHRYIACHVRRTDYTRFRGGVVLPTSFYARCLEQLDPSGRTPVVFVGDDLAETRSVFGARRDVRFEENVEVVDLQLLVHASAVVTSNSSFSWWGAWLGQPARPVLAPRHWLGFKEGRDYPPFVVPRAWEEVDVAR